jgi:ADP-ribose pyrophosphatase YjhB (NUDIX family)
MTMITSLAEQGVTSLYVGGISLSLAVTGDALMMRLLHSFDRERLTSKWKFPGGDSEELETPGSVAYREWAEEVFRPNSRVYLPVSKAVQVHSEDSAEERHPGGVHRKVFYLFDEASLQNYRGDMHFRSSAIPDGEDLLSGTIQLPIFSVGQWLDERGAHMRAFRKAICYIANTRAEYFNLIPTRLLNFAFGNS